MITKEALRRYVEGQSTPEEAERVREHLAAEMGAEQALQQHLDEVWAQSAYNKISEEETNRHWQHLQASIASREKTRPAISHMARTYLPYAAAIALVIVALPFLFNRKESRPTGTVAARIVWDSVVNNGSTVMQVALPDQSTTWLSPNSRLYWSMPKNNNRQVKLEGEAFFDVTHDPAHPFTVQTGALLTKVLGTAFNIEAYGREEAVRISLVRGKVALQQKSLATDSINTLAMLAPGQMISCHKITNTLHKEPLPITDITQYTSGNLILNNVLLTDALDRIAARCHINITCSEQVRKNNRRISTVFRKETPQQIMQIIGFITGCQYREKQNGAIEIY